MASTSEQKALEWIDKGDKAMKKSLFHSADPETASECYEKAGNMYKLDKQWDKAGAVFERAAQCFVDLKDNFGAARQYQSAFLAYKLSDIAKAETVIARATALFVDEVKMSVAAKTQRDLSEVQEKAGRFTEALESLQHAIDYHEAANEPVAASQLKTRAAPLAADVADWQLAASYFEDSAKSASMSTAVVDYYFRAAICHLAMDDTVATSKCIERFGGENVEFLKSAECAFLDSVITSIESYDKNGFEEAAKLFTRNSRNGLDGWKTKVLKMIKDTIPNEGDHEVL
jgi:alpha-soluble NSF attachment protein